VRSISQRGGPVLLQTRGRGLTRHPVGVSLGAFMSKRTRRRRFSPGLGFPWELPIVRGPQSQLSSEEPHRVSPPTPPFTHDVKSIGRAVPSPLASTPWSIWEAIAREELEAGVDAVLGAPPRLTGGGPGTWMSQIARSPARLIASPRTSWERCHSPTGQRDANVTGWTA